MSSARPTRRRALQRHRESLSWAQLSMGLLEVLREQAWWVQTELLCLFWPGKAEFDLRSLLYSTGGGVLLPRIQPERKMSWHLWPCSLLRHPYGILEPSPAAQQSWPDPETRVTVLTPGLAFDTSGHRLGYGGGYYDRFFAACPASWLRVGLCPESCLMPLEPEPWDQPVDLIATPQRCIPAAGLRRPWSESA